MAKTKTILHNKICNFSHVRMKVQMLAYHAGQTRSDTSSLLITLSHWNWIMAGRKPVQMEFHLYRHHPSHLGVTQWPFLEYTSLDIAGAKKAMNSNIWSWCPHNFFINWSESAQTKCEWITHHSCIQTVYTTMNILHCKTQWAIWLLGSLRAPVSSIPIVFLGSSVKTNKQEFIENSIS